MKRFCRLTWKQQSFRLFFIRHITTPSDVNYPSNILSTSIGQFPSSDFSFTEKKIIVSPFISSLTSDLELMEKKWMRNFRVCITNNPIAVIETKTSDTQNWTQVATLDVTNLPHNLIKTVDNVLSSIHLKESNVTILNLHERVEDIISVAEKLILENFPRMRLSIDHSKGKDLQGTITHVVSVSLQSYINISDFTEEEKNIKEKFFGESIGVSFASTVRRAIRQAFEAAGMPPPPSRNFEYNKGNSEMEIFMDIIRNATNEEVNIVPIFIEDSQIKVTVHTNSGNQKTVLCGKREDALSIVLTCVEKIAENVNNIATQEARKRIVDHPIVLALPPKGVKHREILRRLLLHTYGLTENKIHIITSQNNSSTFTCCIDVELHWGEEVVKETPPIIVTLSKTVGINKKAAEDLACMTAIQHCFPRIYEDQLSYHTEIREIMNSSKATSEASICPHISKGLLAQLRWAAQCKNKQVSFDAIQLLPNSENESLGIRTTRALWATQLFLIDNKGIREFICLALDPKKSTSEQKAIAVALWKYFKEECKEGVQYAIDRGLINKDGNVPQCEGISSLPLPKSDYEIAAEFDPFIPNLQLLPTQPIFIPHQKSFLSILRRGVQLYVELLKEKSYDINNKCKNESNESWQLIEYTEKIPTDGSFKAQILLKESDKDSNSEAISIGQITYSTTAIDAIFKAFKNLFEEGGVISNAAKEDNQINEICKETYEFINSLKSLPITLPVSNPLETIAQCVMIKYGLATELHISGGGKIVNVQLYGKSPILLNNDNLNNQTQFFLGHGRGTSLLKAVVSCCKHVFKTHIQKEEQQQQHVFEGENIEIIKTGSVQILLGENSILALKVGEVIKELLENKAVSTSASISVKIDIKSSSSEILYEAQLSVLDGNRVVELERTLSMFNLVNSLSKLTENITKEIGGSSINIDAMYKEFNSPLQYNVLQKLFQTLYGLPLIVKTVLKDKQWHCRLSVQLNKDFYFAIGYAISFKKKDAIEIASIKALNRCFTLSISQTIGSETILSTKTTDIDEKKKSTSKNENSCEYIYRNLSETNVSPPIKEEG